MALAESVVVKYIERRLQSGYIVSMIAAVVLLLASPAFCAPPQIPSNELPQENLPKPSPTG